MKPFLSPELEFAILAVQKAAFLAANIQRELVGAAAKPAALTKEDRSPVTVADFAAQALVARLLKQAFPQDPLVGEESAAALRSPAEKHTLEQVTQFVGRLLPEASPDAICRWIDHGSESPAAPRRFWTLDPIDGTKGFLRGDQYAAALALVEDGQVVLGVLGCPNLHLHASAGRPVLSPGAGGVLAFAQRGQGAWVAPLDTPPAPAHFARLSVSETANPAQARLLRSFESGHTNVDQIEQMAARLGILAAPVKMDSQAKYALLAAGAGEALVRLLSPSQPDYREKIWDQAAGSIVIEEAGGRVTDMHGRPFDFSTGRTLQANQGVLATNGLLHEAFLDALGQIGV